MIEFVKKSISSFVEFEDSLTRTAAIMGETTLGAIERVRTEVETLGRETRSTALEVSEAAQLLALAGFKEVDLVDAKALENLNNLAIAAGVDIPTAASVAISSLRGMGMEVEDLSKVNDVLLQTMNNSFTTIETLGETMKLLAPTAAAAGISLEEAAAAAGALGNAGIQGSMAGTGMRMAINKLIKPTGDARRVMESLNLQVLTLTPAGNAARTALNKVSANLDNLRIEADNTKLAMRALTDELGDMSIEQQRNNLEIARIRQRAAKAGRELTSAEIEQINRLELANEDLNIRMQERSITVAEMSREQERTNRQISESETQFADLNQTISDQTTGITSLSDVFNQLREAGATTSQILQIFGVRGGNAINAIMTQGDAFERLIELNENAQGTTERFADTMKTTTANAVAELNSALTAFMIDVGEQFGPALREDIIPALIEFIQAMQPLIPEFAEIAKVMAKELPNIIEAFIPILLHMGEHFEDIAYVVVALAHIFRFLAYFMEPVLELLGGIGKMFDSIINGDVQGFFEGLLQVFESLALILSPILRVLNAVGKMTGLIAEEGEGTAGQEALGGALKGAAIGGMLGGPVGALAGAAFGGAIGFFAEGGIVEQDTLGVVGEGSGSNHSVR